MSFVAFSANKIKSKLLECTLQLLKMKQVMKIGTDRFQFTAHARNPVMVMYPVLQLFCLHPSYISVQQAQKMGIQSQSSAQLAPPLPEIRLHSWQIWVTKKYISEFLCNPREPSRIENYTIDNFSLSQREVYCQISNLWSLKLSLICHEICQCLQLNFEWKRVSEDRNIRMRDEWIPNNYVRRRQVI